MQARAHAKRAYTCVACARVSRADPPREISSASRGRYLECAKREWSGVKRPLCARQGKMASRNRLSALRYGDIICRKETVLSRCA